MAYKPVAICLMGPTASGKTELAIELLKHLPCEIISVDSAMIYRGMDIGTAKPDAATLAAAPHRLIDFLDPVEAYSAARFREDALREMSEVSEAGGIPLLVGGTMLYFRALEHGLSELPAANPEVRAEIDAQAQALGWEALHERLQGIDPQAASRIHPNDPQRLQRALEVHEVSGKTLTELCAQRDAVELPYRLVKLALIPDDRALLRTRIAQRFEIMLDQGLINEVETLYQRGDLNLSMPSMRAVGYRQVWKFLAGELNAEAMQLEAVTATRQLAKRQLTWLRSETGLQVIDAQDYEISSVITYLEAILN